MRIAAVDVLRNFEETADAIIRMAMELSAQRSPGVTRALRIRRPARSYCMSAWRRGGV